MAEALIKIYEEIEQIKTGKFTKENNPLKNAPHILLDLTSEPYLLPYPRNLAFPQIVLKRDGFKIIPPVSRINSAYGDTHLELTSRI